MAKGEDIRGITHNEQGERTWGIEGKIESEYSFLRQDMPKIEFTDIQCKSQRVSYVKEFYVVNEHKASFCYGLYREFLDFDIQKLIDFLPVVKNAQADIHAFKGAFYCTLCDAHQQKYISVNKKQIHYAMDFCRDILKYKKEFFYFVHVMMIQYYQKLFDYVTCFETQGTIPKVQATVLQKYLRRIPYIENCLMSLDLEDGFMENCWFICKNMNSLKISPFFDGDIELLKRVYLLIFSFMRKFQISQDDYKKEAVTSQLDNQTSINGLIVEPILPSAMMSKRYYLDESFRRNIFGNDDIRKSDPVKREQMESIMQEFGFSQKQIEQNLDQNSLPQLRRVQKGHEQLIDFLSDLIPQWQ